MAKLKIKTHATYTYETSDGREFEDKPEAEAWQEHLEVAKNITMLNSKFCNTTNLDEAIYVHIKNQKQQEAFAAIQNYEGMCAQIPEPGYWYYDEHTDTYKNAVTERDRLQSIIETLEVFGR